MVDFRSGNPRTIAVPSITPLDPGDLEGGFVRMMKRFHLSGTLTGDLEADAYLRQDANALLLGLLYDQRVRAEFAFTGPLRLRKRLGHLDLCRIAQMPLETPAAAAFCRKASGASLYPSHGRADASRGTAALHPLRRPSCPAVGRRCAPH